MFSTTFSHTFTIAKRVFSQLLKDRRLLALSLVVPMLLVYLFKLFFDTLSGPGFSPVRYIVPVTAFLVHFLTYLLCAIVLVRERVAQTLTRMFVNGFQRGEIIVGYILAYSVLATLQSAIVLIELNWLFNLNYDIGQFASIYVVIWVLAVISIALGIFFSNFARNEGQVFPFIPLVIVPSVFLSGMLVAVERLPDWLQWLSRAVPLYYANTILQQFVKPNGSLWNESGSLLALIVYGFIILALANLTLQEDK